MKYPWKMPKKDLKNECPGMPRDARDASKPEGCPIQGCPKDATGLKWGLKWGIEVGVQYCFPILLPILLFQGTRPGQPSRLVRLAWRLSAGGSRTTFQHPFRPGQDQTQKVGCPGLFQDYSRTVQVFSGTFRLQDQPGPVNAQNSPVWLLFAFVVPGVLWIALPLVLRMSRIRA